jgi:hypothetical protein
MFFFYFLTVCNCFTFKKYTGVSKFPFQALIILHNEQVVWLVTVCCYGILGLMGQDLWMCFVVTVAMVMLWRDFGPYVTRFVNVCFVVAVAAVMLWRDFGPLGQDLWVCVCCSRCHGNAVKGFWTLSDKICECVFCCSRCYDNAVKGFWTLWDNMCVCCCCSTVALAMMLS